MKLKLKSQTVLLLLKQGFNTDAIPNSILTAEARKELEDYGLIEWKDGNIVLTEKSNRVIEDGRYIVKYPLSDEEGNVKNYNDILKGMNRNAATSLGLAMINEGFHKKFSKYANLKLLRLLEESEYYYSLSSHPIERIRIMATKVKDAEERMYLTIDEEFNKIADFTLLKPILIGYDEQKNKLTIVKVNNGILTLNNGDTMLVGQMNNLNYITKEKVIRQCYSRKADANRRKKMIAKEAPSDDIKGSMRTSSDSDISTTNNRASST